MSTEYFVQNSQMPQPRKRGGSLTCLIASSLLLIIVLFSLTGWLIYDVFKLKENVKEIETELSATKMELSAIKSELATVGAIARNADMYSHSHYSDIRMKQDVEDLTNVLANVLQLRAVTFNWNTDEYPDMGFGNQPQIGFLAQDIEQVYPELVSVDPNGFKMVDYAGLTPILLEAIKEQQAAIDELQLKNDELKNRLITLEALAGISK